VGKSEGKRSQGRLRHRWEDNVKVGLRERGWDVVYQWGDLVNMVINLSVP
jgi:hypothetical protein